MLGPGKRVCRFCTRNQAKYTCPKCDIPYCSVQCYRKHGLKCTESFYKDSVLQEARLRDAEDVELKKLQKKELLEILKRDAQLREQLESEEYEGQYKSLEERLKTAFQITGEVALEEVQRRLDSAKVEEIEAVLSKNEIERFVKEATQGKVLKPEACSPWWKRDVFVSESLSNERRPLHKRIVDTPPCLMNPLPAFSSLSAKDPSPHIVYHVVNLVLAYVVTTYKFNGDLMSDSDTLRASSEYLFELATVLNNSKFKPTSVEMACELGKTQYPSVILAKQKQHTLKIVNDESDHIKGQFWEDVKIMFSEKDILIDALKDTWFLFHSITKQSKTYGNALARCERKLWYFLIWTNSHYDESLKAKVLLY